MGTIVIMKLVDSDSTHTHLLWWVLDQKPPRAHLDGGLRSAAISCPHWGSDLFEKL
jgi:hypothetical protein